MLMGAGGSGHTAKRSGKVGWKGIDQAEESAVSSSREWWLVWIGIAGVFGPDTATELVVWPGVRANLLRHQCSSHDDHAGSTQFSTFSPPTRRNSLVLFVTSVALSASAWQAIHRSFAPTGVPASFRRVDCSA